MNMRIEYRITNSKMHTNQLPGFRRIPVYFRRPFVGESACRHEFTKHVFPRFIKPVWPNPANSLNRVWPAGGCMGVGVGVGDCSGAALIYEWYMNMNMNDNNNVNTCRTTFRKRFFPSCCCCMVFDRNAWFVRIAFVTAFAFIFALPWFWPLTPQTLQL